MSHSWCETNQRHLVDAIAGVHAALERHVARVQGGEQSAHVTDGVVSHVSADLVVAPVSRH
jgi:hypothetical protein